MNDPYYGFECHSTRQSNQVSSAYKKAVEHVAALLERVDGLVTSTPKNNSRGNMEFFARCYEEASGLDNDSGYVSQQTFEHKEEISTTTTVPNVSTTVYLSEDALLEKPVEVPPQSYEDNESDSVLESSVISSNSLDLSGQSGVSTSSIIPHIEPIVFHNHAGASCPKENSFDSQDKNESTDISINCDLSLSSIASSSKDFLSETNSTFLQIPTPKKPLLSINADFSPDLFSDDEQNKSPVKKVVPIVLREMYVKDEDNKLLKRVKECMGGLLPPLSVTINQLNVTDILQRLEENKNYFTNTSQTSTGKSLLITHPRDEIHNNWPDVMHQRHHGLHFNCSKVSEEFEHLCLKYAERFIGAETQSTCTVFSTDKPSPLKRRFSRLRRNLKSPGKRLSHLARRRITFTKDSLQSSSVLMVGSRTRQILVDARKPEATTNRKSPWKKSPRKTQSPKKKFPSPGNSRGRFLSRLKMHTTTTEEEASTSKTNSVKRSLFDANRSFCDSDSNSSIISVGKSPKRATPRRVLFPVKSSPTKSGSSTLYPNKKQTPVRALFSKESPSQRKRKRTDSDSSKENLPSVRSNSSSNLSSHEISEHRKKKLLWAVAEALRSQNIGLDHPQFKTFASTLARVTRRLLPNLFTNTLVKTEGSTSENMLRIARQHVFAVTRGKTIDEIMEAILQQKISRPMKISGYIGPDKPSTITSSMNREPQRILQDRANILSAGGNTHNQKIERIRRAINFDNQEETSSTGIR